MQESERRGKPASRPTHAHTCFGQLENCESGMLGPALRYALQTRTPLELSLSLHRVLWPLPYL